MSTLDQFDDPIPAGLAIGTYFGKRDNAPGIDHQNSQEIINIINKVGMADVPIASECIYDWLLRLANINKIGYMADKRQRKK